MWLSFAERLRIVEDVLRGIRENDAPQVEDFESKMEDHAGLTILATAGILDEKDAIFFEDAVTESREIDKNEWWVYSCCGLLKSKNHKSLEKTV